ncbi:MAG: toxin-antitoxin system TumE family protein [Candidatus Anammoxibacter sp.]
MKIKAKLLDGSLLFITELSTTDRQKYSYHWQQENGNLIIRWDNKPHWKNFKTFPHHKHEKDKTLSSQRINIDDVIREIRQKLLTSP